MSKTSPTVPQHRRAEIESRIEELIDLLDVLDGDPDLEPYLSDTSADDREGAEDDPHGIETREGDTSDYEPSCGWTHVEASYGKYGAGQGDMEEEEVNEDGGDINDEPHDPDPDLEHSLGWANPMGLRVHVPEEAAQLVDGVYGSGEEGSLTGYDGDGHHIGRKLLRDHVKDPRKLAKALDATRVSPG